jgi:hypothetical protein
MTCGRGAQLVMPKRWILEVPPRTDRSFRPAKEVSVPGLERFQDAEPMLKGLYSRKQGR